MSSGLNRSTSLEAALAETDDAIVVGENWSEEPAWLLQTGETILGSAITKSGPQFGGVGKRLTPAVLKNQIAVLLSDTKSN